MMEIKTGLPTCCQNQMMGHLKSRGHRVQQERVREVMRRVDPAGSIMRCLCALNRRQYSVPAPGSLCHIDGNHKLIHIIDAGGALLSMGGSTDSLCASLRVLRFAQLIPFSRRIIFAVFTDRPPSAKNFAPRSLFN